MTLEEVAAELGISHQSVWQIEKRLIAKIRRALKRHNITYEELELCLKHS